MGTNAMSGDGDSNGIELSIVVPMYNESECIDRFFDELLKVLAEITENYEIVCVNDGSQDDTLERLVGYFEKDPRVVVIDLARNFGKDKALTAGLDYARGRAVIPIDADLQDPPELIKELVKKWKEGYEVVYAKRTTRAGEPWIKKISANLFYKILDRISYVDIPRNTGDFRLMDRQVVEAVKRLPERTRFMKGIFAWVGFRSVAVEYERGPRSGGQTKWRYGGLFRFAIDGIASFSALPVKLWTLIGTIIAGLSFGYMLFLLVRTLVLGIDLPGYASLMTVILFLGGVQLIGIDVLGEYTARIFDEVKGRPLYIVRDTLIHTDAEIEK